MIEFTDKEVLTMEQWAQEAWNKKLEEVKATKNFYKGVKLSEQAAHIGGIQYKLSIMRDKKVAPILFNHDELRCIGNATFIRALRYLEESLNEDNPEQKKLDYDIACDYKSIAEKVDDYSKEIKK